MKRPRKIAVMTTRINATMSALAVYFAGHKKMHLLFGTALAISLACCLDNNGRTIIPSLQNAIPTDSLASNTFKTEVKVGNHEFVIFVK